MNSQADEEKQTRECLCKTNGQIEDLRGRSYAAQQAEHFPERHQQAQDESHAPKPEPVATDKTQDQEADENDVNGRERVKTVAQPSAKRDSNRRRERQGASTVFRFNLDVDVVA
jgi:hypothetical protein